MRPTSIAICGPTHALSSARDPSCTGFARWALAAGLAAAACVIQAPASAVSFPREVVPGVHETAPPRSDGAGLVTHTLRSGFQSGEQALHVLLPVTAGAGRRTVLYVLPVHQGAEAARAGLEEIRRLGLHERHALICVGPAFATAPWYADHPTDPQARQESHLLHAVLPLVEGSYSVKEGPAGRLLVGFSKSGCGTFSLLLRHPEVFGRAASWDAPLALDRPGRWGTDRVWSTAESFEEYRITTLLRKRAGLLRSGPARLALMGYGKFPDDGLLIRRLMVDLGIPHCWEHGPERRHGWTSGWIEPAVTALMKMR